MKVARLYTLDLELVERLKNEENASGLINGLLTKHYKDFRSEEQIIKDTMKLVKEKAEKQALHDKYNNPKHIEKRKKEMLKAKNDKKGV